MRRGSRLFPYLLCLIILSLFGCSNLDFNTEGMLIPPVNKKSAIQGTWQIEKFVSVKENVDEIEQYIGETAMFDEDVCMMGEEECIDPEYKIINVATADYFHNKYRMNTDQLQLSNERVDVITVTADYQILYEFIKIDDDTLLAYVAGGFLYLNKISDEVNGGVKQTIVKDNKVIVDSEKKKENEEKAGVLLGIRSANNTYQTLWISSENGNLNPILMNKQLLVPRKTGFWEVGRSSSRESIYAKPLTDHEKPSILSVENKNMLAGSPDSEILFVGNDYIGTEHKLKLKVLPIDNISVGKGIKLTNVTTENAYETMLRSSEAFIASMDREEAQYIIQSPLEDNFTLERRSGHWIMKGRLYYEQPIGEKEYEDFDMNILVPSKLINYDELSIQWGEIKSSLPWMLDAYQSPLQDMALLTSKDSLSIYAMEDGRILEQPLREIALQEGDAIIMAEWAIGDYVDKWDEIVKESFNILE